MLSIYIFGIFSFLFYSTFANNECPKLKQCICSSDLTIITCSNQEITDEILINLNKELPSTTIVLNLSSNSLRSINSLSNLNNLQTLDISFNRIDYLPKKLFLKFSQLSSLYVSSNNVKIIPKTFNEISNINFDISNNPLNCTCQLKWLIKWFETINLLKKINCQKGKYLTENDFCFNKNSYIDISPSQSQIVYQNDPFILNCSSNTNIYWTFNNEYYSNKSIIYLSHIQLNHSGLWTCHSLNENRSISLHVLNIRTNQFCPSIQMDTSKGYFSWPRTLTGQIIQVKCPFNSAAWLINSNENAQASYTCSNNRQWTDLNLSECAFRTNISREFDNLISKNQTNLLSKLVRYISKINLNTFQFDDIIFLIDLIDNEYEKSIYLKKNLEEVSMLIYRLTDLILQINHQHFSIINQYQLALYRLRLILEKLIHLTNHSWVYVGKQLTAMTLESPLPPTICFIPNRPLLTIICGILNRQYKRHESRLATISFPFKSNITLNQSSIFRIIFYRQSILYRIDKNINSNPVIYMKPITKFNYSTVKLTFYGQSNQASIGIWNLNKSSWEMDSSSCKIEQQNIDLISSDCILRENISLSITYLNEYKSLFLNNNYLQISIYVSSIIASSCFFISILFYICCYKVYLMPRSFFHCLINYWISLFILFPLFAFGIRQSEYLFFCQLISISLHYLCLTTILWLTLLTYCIWQKLYRIWSGKGYDDETNDNINGKSSVTIVDYDDDGLPIMKIKAKPIIQFYFLGYGISFIICGINVAISREQYITNKICFLNNFESLLTLFIPIGIFIFLLLIFLLAAQINIKRLTKEAIRLRNLPDENENENENEIESETNIENEENILSKKINETLPIIVPSNNIEENLPHIDCHQSHLDSICSSDMDHQHQPKNQLLSILFQLIILIFIFLSSLSIYIHPLNSYNIPYEHSIYNHLYGFFVLLLSFYILSFYVLSRSDLTMHCQYYNCCSNRNKKRLLNQSYAEPPPPPQTPQQSPSQIHNPSISKEIDTNKIFSNQNLNVDESFIEHIPAPSPPHSHYSSSIYQCQKEDNSEITTTITNVYTYGSKYQTNIASKYYARHRHLLKNNVSNSETSLQQNDTYPISNLNTIQQESTTSIDGQKLEQEFSPKNSFNSPKENGTARFHLPTIVSPRTFIRPSTLSLSSCQPQSSPSQAIIRPLPIIRLSSPNTNQPPLSSSSSNPIIEQNTGRNSYRVMPSPSTEERHATYVYLNKNSNLIQQDNCSKEKTSIWKKPLNGHHPHVAYIDEDDEASVSLKSSTCQSTSSSTTSPILTRKDRSQTLSSSSSSSSSSTFSRNFCNDINQMILHESSV